MEESFYLVPVLDENIHVEEQRICDLCIEKFPKLFKLEKKKDVFLTTKNDKIDASSVIEIVDECYDSLKIPKFLIIINDEGTYYELVSKIIVSLDEPSQIDKYRIEDSGIIVNYFVTSDYENKINHLFKKYGFLNKKNTPIRQIKKV